MRVCQEITSIGLLENNTMSNIQRGIECNFEDENYFQLFRRYWIVRFSWGKHQHIKTTDYTSIKIHSKQSISRKEFIKKNKNDTFYQYGNKTFLIFSYQVQDLTLNSHLFSSELFGAMFIVIGRVYTTERICWKCNIGLTVLGGGA